MTQNSQKDDIKHVFWFNVNSWCIEANEEKQRELGARANSSLKH